MKKVRCNTRSTFVKTDCNQFAVKQFGLCQIHWTENSNAEKTFFKTMTAFVNDVALEMRVA